MSERVYKFSGTHKEIGKQVGEVYKSWGRGGVRIAPNADYFFKDQLAIYQKFFPQYLDYVEGLAESLKVAKDDTIKSLTTIYLEHLDPIPHKCSTLVINNSNGVFVGRNYDWREASEAYSSIFRFDITDNSANSFYGISDLSIFSTPGEMVNRARCVFISEDAWNDKGLYICLNGAPAGKRTPGMTTPHVVQCIVETCSTTHEALSLIKEIPMTDSKLFTIADKNGDLVVAEKHSELGVRVRSSHKFLITTNHFMHEDLYKENASLFKSVPFHSTFARYNYMNVMLEKQYDLIGFEDVGQLMSCAPVVQNWRGRENGDVVTTWKLALDLKSGKFNVTFAPLAEDKQTITSGNF